MEEELQRYVLDVKCPMCHDLLIPVTVNHGLQTKIRFIYVVILNKKVRVKKNV